MVEGTLRGVMIRKALDIRSWDAGQAMIREWEATGLGADAPTVTEAVGAFLKDAVARNVRPGTLKNLRVLLTDLEGYAERKGVQLVKGFDTEKVRDFREGWKVLGRDGREEA